MVTINSYHGMPTEAMIRNISVHDTLFGGRTASAQPGTCAGGHHQRQEGWGQQAEGRGQRPSEVRLGDRHVPASCPASALGAGLAKKKKKKSTGSESDQSSRSDNRFTERRGEAQWTPRECNLGRQTVGKGTGQMTLFLHQGQKKGGGERGNGKEPAV